MKKIMFNDSYGLTQAVLNGTKTMTRRIGEKYLTELIKGHETDFTVTSQRACPNHLVVESPQLPHGICLWLGTKYRLGEVIAVAQSYETLANSGYLDKMVVPANNPVKCEFKKEYCTPGWSNKMFVRPDLMPHQIQITDIKIERLQDISDEDCIKEGIYVNPNPPKWREYDPYEPWPPYVKPYKFTTIKGFCKPQFAFAYLIDAVSGKGTWQSNPIVVAYSFRLIK